MAWKMNAASFSSLAVFFTSMLFLLLVCSRLHFSEAQSSAQIVSGFSWTFYESSCPKLEDIIQKRLNNVFDDDIGQAAGILRLHFHDCFVLVYFTSLCRSDFGSLISAWIIRTIIVKLNFALPFPLQWAKTEQDTPPNLSLRAEAFKIINDLRERVHKKCGQVVSCADITAFAARDAVYLVNFFQT
ncbi:peroxidase 12-like [Diospyros lotus]|uniref:peroxidase 12-like n=1 Tax=Diospyros lotus TaxID=55363 RepID=UPI00225AE37E|nr:peroxidase 12-like [Diospyros lotus]XP_052185247.1 peroxidase 12-like [Diospyros lotus]